MSKSTKNETNDGKKPINKGLTKREEEELSKLPPLMPLILPRLDTPGMTHRSNFVQKRS
jgi:hypothetical protein